MNYKTYLFIASMLLFAACDSIEEIPEDKKKYVGVWRSENAAIEIKDDGFVSYAKIVDGVSETVEGPIKEFEGDSFIVGFWFITKKFEVQEKPHIDGNSYKMKINDMEFTRIDDM